MAIIKSINLLLRFFLELCVLAAVGYWGFYVGQQLVVRIILGIGLPFLYAVAWGIFLAPAAARRLREPWLLILELVIFGSAIAALYSTAEHRLAGIFGLVYVINKILMYVWKQ